MSLKISDVLPDTPPEDHPELAALLYASTEFRQLEEPFALAPNPLSGPELTLPYNHQAVVGRYFSPLTGRDRGLIMPEPGMGKTLMLILLTEQTASFDKKALVLVQNKPMVDNFVANVAKFTGTKYTGQQAEEEPIIPETEEYFGQSAAKEYKLTKLKDNYEFGTYTGFSDHILANFDPEKHALKSDFVQQYRGRRIVCDESHHISATRQTKDESKLHITDQALEKVCGKGNIGWLRGIRETYRAFFLFFHTIPDCQVFFSTATPIIDRKTEFCFQMNLLLPKERLFLAPNSSFSAFNALEGDQLLIDIYKRCRGMISYARSQYRARREDVGIKIGSQEVDGEPVEFVTRYVPCPMSKEQYEVVDGIDREVRSKQADPESYDIDADDTNSFMYRSRAGSSMVYPYQNEYLVGNDKLPKPRTMKYTFQNKIETKTIRTVFDYYFESTGDKRSWKLRNIEPLDSNNKQHQNDINKFKEILSDVKTSKGLTKLSSKYAYIVNELLRDPDNDRKVSYIYTPLVKGSGLVPLLISLTLNGYQEYLPKGASDSKSIREIIRGMIAENNNAIRAGNRVPRRVAVITSNMSKTQIDEIKSIINAPENARGALIHVLLGSPASGESISLSHVRRVIVASPAWNDSIMRQVIGRAFRIDSHSIRDFPDDVVVQVILLAATIPLSIEAEAAKNKRQLLLPPDVYILRLSEYKGRRNGKVYRAAKQCCFDGMINKRLNQDRNEIYPTAENDYLPGDYPIVSGDIKLEKDDTFTPIEPKLINNKTYALYYDRSRLDVRDKILRYFRANTIASLEKLVEVLGYDRETILYALDSIIQDRIQVQSAWGIQQYLMEHDNVYFLQALYNDPDPFLEHYSQCTYVEGVKDNESFVQVAAKDLVRATVDTMNKNPEDMQEQFTNLYNIIREKIAIMYEGIIDSTLDPHPEEEVRNYILERFEANVGVIDVFGNKLAYHKLYYVGEQRMAGDSSYGKGVPLRTAKSLGKPSRIRVYGLEEGVWRYATNEEDEEIVKYINKRIEDQKEAMKIHPFYGNRFRLDGSLHLFFPGQQKKVTTRKKKTSTKKTSAKRKSTPKSEEEEEQEAENLDKRFIGTIGKDAVTEHKTTLVKVLWELSLMTKDEPKYYDEGFNMSRAPKTEEERMSLIEDLKKDTGTKKSAEKKVSIPLLGQPLESLSPDMLYFVWWFFLGNPKLTVPAIQPLLVERLERLGLLIDR